MDLLRSDSAYKYFDLLQEELEDDVFRVYDLDQNNTIEFRVLRTVLL